MDLQRAHDLTIEKMREHNLLDWTFKFDYSKQRFGCCNYKKKQISLSKHLTFFNNEQHVLNTILHEIAHALVPPGNNHNHIWREKAMSIGCSGTRCYDSAVVIRPEPKYVYQCPTCKIESKRFRVMRRPLACKNCCEKYNAGKYTTQFLFVRVK